MRIVADLHIHSRFSRATSPKLTVPYLERWARIKGIDLVGTGDCTHPAWLAELGEQLEAAGEGVYRLKDGPRTDFDRGAALADELPDPSGVAPDGSVPPGAAGPQGSGGQPRAEPRFVLSGEISTIYSAGGKTRKVHHLVLLPDFAAASRFQAILERTGNIRSDGRPILGLSSRDLLAALLDADERSLLIPAHIWTPWFSALGARSGFDSIEECYGDLSSRIVAIETGLSSNPPMNWAVSSLDRYGIVSNSDAHSPEKLGREATIFEMEESYPGLAAALTGSARPAGGANVLPSVGGAAGVLGTVEFYPQEGKYHYDGHRACSVVLDPGESVALGGLCPVCGKPLTQGVLRRVSELADRPVVEDASCPDDPGRTSNRRPYRSLVPLPELLGELLGVGPSSKKVSAAYRRLVELAGSEFRLLLDLDEGELGRLSVPGLSGELLREAVGRVRSGRVSITAGYDGEYGKIRAFAPGEGRRARAADALFPELADPAAGGMGRGGAPSKDSAMVSSGRRQRPGTPGAAESLENVASGSAMESPGVSISRRGPSRDPASTSLDGTGGPGALGAAGLPESGAASGASRSGRRRSRDPAAPRQGGAGSAETVSGPAADSPGAGALTLDPAQERAVAHRGGPALVLAGPGTGKTAVLTLRAEALVRDGAAPSTILALTFTNKAAGELRSRLGRALGSDRAAAVTAGTFHSFCLSLLREHSGPAGLASGFRVLGQDERNALVAKVAAAGLPRRRRGVLGPYIEGRKRFLLKPGETEPRLGPLAPGELQELAAELDVAPSDDELEVAYGKYREALAAEGALDFDDLVAGTVRLLSRNAEVLDGLRRRYRTVFVDEFQDLNFAQYALLRILCPGTGSAGPVPFVIGDPNQAIYAFRGSDPRLVRRFTVDYPDAVTYSLDRSFRCAPAIIDAASSLVDSALRGSGAATALFRREYRTDKSEAEGIARRIAALIGGTGFFAFDSGVVDTRSDARVPGRLGEADTAACGTSGAAEPGPGIGSLRDCAILVRASALAFPIAEALRNHGIPYRVVGERPWWEDEPARTLVALLVERYGRDGNVDPVEAFREAAASLEAGEGKPSPAAARLGTGAGEIEGAGPSGRTVDGRSEGRGIRGDAGRKSVSAEALERLSSLASAFGSLGSFLDALSLGDSQDGWDERSERVSIMTIHAAKGLEFDYVFVAGLEEGLLPFTLFDESPDSDGESRMEEERRLLYVAMTRARFGLELSWARRRQFRGRTLELPPSRFLSELERLVPPGAAAPSRKRDPQLGLF